MKRILIISPTFPYPPNIGDRLRIYNIIKELSHQNRIDLAALDFNPIINLQLTEMKKYCNDIFAYHKKDQHYIPALKTLITDLPYRVHKYQSRDFQEKVQKILEAETYDVIWCNFLEMAIYLPKTPFPGDSLVVLDQHNEDELFWRTYYENSSNLFFKLLAKKTIINLKKFRKKQIEKYDLILSVSERDRDFTKSWAPSAILTTLGPNGVDLEYFTPGNKNSIHELNCKNIIFCGSMDVTMNIDAVYNFLKYILPKVKKEIKSLKFWIVGRNPDKKMRKIGDEDIIVTGTVEDVRPYYERAHLFVAPFNFGGGTKLKILEAMAMGVPIVSTSIGIQGINVVDGEEVLIRDNWDAFAAAIIKVLHDKETGKGLSLRSRIKVEKEYSWKAIVQRLEVEIENLLYSKRGK